MNFTAHSMYEFPSALEDVAKEHGMASVIARSGAAVSRRVGGASVVSQIEAAAPAVVAPSAWQRPEAEAAERPMGAYVAEQAAALAGAGSMAVRAVQASQQHRMEWQ